MEEKEYQIFDIQKPPSFPGGERELLKYLAENIKYPPLARENNIQGSVALSFVIQKDGSVSDVSVLKDIGGGCGKEAERLIGIMRCDRGLDHPQQSVEVLDQRPLLAPVDEGG